MARGFELSEGKRAQVLLLHEMGFSQRKIACKLLVSRCAVRRCIDRYKTCTKSTAEGLKSKKRSGRPKVTTQRTDNLIVRLSKRSPRASAARIQSQLPRVDQVSTRTVRRRLFTSGLKARKPAKKPLLSKKNIRDRIAFCKKYKGWTSDDWENVFFSDESTFSQFYNFTGYVRRPKGKRHDQKYCTSTVKQPKKLMVWGCFSGKSGRGAIWFMPPGSTINSGVYVGILKEKLLPFRQIHQVQYFQHDGAPCHMAACVSKWLASEHIPVIGPWPGSSPDLNPIEHLWSQMKRKVAVRNPTSVENLKEVIKSVWVTETALDACKALARSMPRRIVAVLAAKGHHTKY